MQPQKLCLKWNNHTTNLLAVLGSFQQKDILVDVTISCEGQNIKAHKMVLSACSPYFQSIFLENPCKHPVIIINGIKFEDITAILNFMYKGEVNVSQDGLSSFLQAAEALKVKGLAEVCGEKKSTNSMNQEVQQSEQNRPQRTDTPPRKRHRNRKRSLSDSNRSDDEGTARKHREHSSPEIHELSGDESFTGDNTSNGPPFNSVPRVPQNVYSRSHQSSSNLGGEEDEDFEVEPSKLLEQTLTTENVSMNNSNSDNNLRIERIMGNATEMESSSMQEPESPPDIKPVIDYGESGAGTSEGNLMLYSDQSQPGPSSVQDSLLHDSSHTQEMDNGETSSNEFNKGHVCETTRLLKELKEDPICLCHFNDSDILEVTADDEIQLENIKCLKRSKQLLIYNEEGCLKGIELNKGITTENSVNSNDATSSCFTPAQENGELLEVSDSSNRNFQSYDLPLEKFERNENFIYNSRCSTNSNHLDASPNRTLTLVPQPYTHYSVTKPLKIPARGRGRPKSSKAQLKKSLNKDSSFTNLQRNGANSLPRTVLGKQSFTKVSFEEVHVADSIQRPRRNKTQRSASEMLMLRRKIRKKIVQRTSIEYQSENIDQEEYSSNTDTQMSVHRKNKLGKKASNNGTKRKYTRKSQNISESFENGVVKQKMKRKYTRHHSIPEVEKYGPNLLPPGWNTQVVTRKTGKTAGQIDVYFIGPDGKRVRSRVELAAYIRKNALPYSPEEFCFRKSAYSSNMLTYDTTQ